MGCSVTLLSLPFGSILIFTPGAPCFLSNTHHSFAAWGAASRCRVLFCTFPLASAGEIPSAFSSYFSLRRWVQRHAASDLSLPQKKHRLAVFFLYGRYCRNGYLLSGNENIATHQSELRYSLGPLPVAYPGGFHGYAILSQFTIVVYFASAHILLCSLDFRLAAFSTCWFYFNTHSRGAFLSLQHTPFLRGMGCSVTLPAAGGARLRPSRFDSFTLKNMEPKRVPCFLAGVKGFEPLDAGVRVPCLTAWRHPNINFFITASSF